MPRLQNELMKAIVSAYMIPTSTFQWVYSNTGSNSKLRQVVAALLAPRMRILSKEQWADYEFRYELFLDIIIVMAKTADGSMRNPKAEPYFLAVV